MNANLGKITLYDKLPLANKTFLATISCDHKFSFQQLRFLVEFEVDLCCWQMGSLEQFYKKDTQPSKDKQSVKKVFSLFEIGYRDIKNSQKSYKNKGVIFAETSSFKEEIIIKPLTGNIMGECPVASEKTRCCNLHTLDAVRQCGFECSYCSIQSFYYNNQVAFTEDLAEHLHSLSLDPDKTYHIGTGQSSDSLMWGNKENLFESLCEFAEKNPNVILEMKTKSSNIGYFIKNRPPRNMIFTWSLNTDLVISAEEKGTASLEKRIESARALSTLGIPVGFHFHPMVWYEGWRQDYQSIVTKITEKFTPEEVVMVSIGTLTFIKPVLKRIRERMLKSSILQMPTVDSAGKLSYPFEIKKDLFSAVYDGFPKDWQEKVFFYMCMEDEKLWQPVLQRSYKTNEEFEQDMLSSYMEKINFIAKR
ncbi:MAG: DNA photolyase [Desulfotalea sp.]